MKKLSLKTSKFNKGEVLTRAQLKKVMGGDGSGTGSDVFGKCTVKTTCSTGSVECSSDNGKCYKGRDYVQCDSDATIYCNN